MIKLYAFFSFLSLLLLFSFQSNAQDNDVLVYRIIQKDGKTSDWHKFVIDATAKEINKYDGLPGNHSIYTIKSAVTFDAYDSFWVRYTCDDHVFSADYIITLQHYKGSKRAKIITELMKTTPKVYDVILY